MEDSAVLWPLCAQYSRWGPRDRITLDEGIRLAEGFLMNPPWPDPRPAAAVLPPYGTRALFFSI